MKTIHSAALLVATAATFGAAVFAIRHLNLNLADLFDIGVGVFATAGLLRLLAWDTATVPPLTRPPVREARPAAATGCRPKSARILHAPAALAGAR